MKEQILCFPCTVEPPPVCHSQWKRVRNMEIFHLVFSITSPSTQPLLVRGDLQELFLGDISAQSFISSECSRIYLGEEVKEQFYSAFGSQ